MSDNTPAFLSAEAVETGYRLCAIQRPAEPQPGGTVFHAALLPGKNTQVAIATSKGLLCVRDPHTQDGIDYQIFLQAMSAYDGDQSRGADAARMPSPKPMRLPWDGFAFVPGAQRSLFLLLGETNVIMYTTLPSPPPSVLEPVPHIAGSTRRTSSEAGLGNFVYGSRVLALEGRHKVRIRTLAVDPTATVLASGDEDGICSIWPLGRRHGADDSPDNSLTTGGSDSSGRGFGSTIIHAHSGPVLALAHGRALPGEEGQIVTGSLDRTVRVWSWRLEPSEGGGDHAHGLEQRLVVEPVHSLLTDSCHILCLDAASTSVVAGSSQGTLYAWSSLGALQCMAVSSTKAILSLAASHDSSLVVTGDDAGVVRLYRRSGAANEGVKRLSCPWRLVGECPLDGPVVGVMINQEHADGLELVVVSATGMMLPWSAEALPKTAQDAAPEPRVTVQGGTPVLSAAAHPTPGHSDDSDGVEESKLTPPPDRDESLDGGGADGKHHASLARDVGGSERFDVDGEDEARADVPVPLPVSPHVRFDPIAEVIDEPDVVSLGDTEEQDEPEPEPRRQGPPLPASLVPAPAAASGSSDQTSPPRQQGPERTGQGTAEKATWLKVPKPRLTGAQGRSPGAPRSVTGWRQARGADRPPVSTLAHPGLYSSIFIAQALQEAQQQQFDEDAVDADTSSVLEEAAKAVNFDPRQPVFKDMDVQGDASNERPMHLVKKQIDSGWLAKQELRPTAEDFFTPDLEPKALARFRANPAPRLSEASSRCALDPLATIFRAVL